MARLILMLVAGLAMVGCGPSEADIANTISAQVEAEVARRLAETELSVEVRNSTDNVATSNTTAKAASEANSETDEPMDDLTESDVAAPANHHRADPTR